MNKNIKLLIIVLFLVSGAFILIMLNSLVIWGIGILLLKIFQFDYIFSFKHAIFISLMISFLKILLDEKNQKGGEK